MLAAGLDQYSPRWEEAEVSLCHGGGWGGMSKEEAPC